MEITPLALSLLPRRTLPKSGAFRLSRFQCQRRRRGTARTFDVNNRITYEQTGLIQLAGHALGDLSQGQDTETHHVDYDENGQKSSYQDPRGRITTYDYDNRNRLWKTNEYPIAPGDPNTPRTTETQYNAAGNKTLVIFPDGKTQQWPDYAYDAFGQPHLLSMRDRIQPIWIIGRGAR